MKILKFIQHLLQKLPIPAGRDMIEGAIGVAILGVLASIWTGLILGWGTFICYVFPPNYQGQDPTNVHVIVGMASLLLIAAFAASVAALARAIVWLRDQWAEFEPAPEQIDSNYADDAIKGIIKDYKEAEEAGKLLKVY